MDARKTCQLATLRKYGLLVVTFMICARSASVREPRTSDIQISGREIALQLRHFKKSDTCVVPRIALRVPITNDADGIGLLLWRSASAAARSGQLFPDRTLRKATSAATLLQVVASALAETGTLAPCSAMCLSGRNQGPTVQQQHQQQQQPTRVADAGQPYGVSDSPFPFKLVYGPQ